MKGQKPTSEGRDLVPGTCVSTKVSPPPLRPEGVDATESGCRTTTPVETEGCTRSKESQGSYGKGPWSGPRLTTLGRYYCRYVSGFVTTPVAGH